MQISSQRERNEEGARWRVKSSYVQWSPISNGTRERRRFAARVEPAQKASNNGACRHCWSRRGATSAGRAPHLASPVFHFISTSTVVGSKRISFVRWSNTAYNIKLMELSLQRVTLWRRFMAKTGSCIFPNTDLQGAPGRIRVPGMHHNPGCGRVSRHKNPCALW